MSSRKNEDQSLAIESGMLLESLQHPAMIIDVRDKIILSANKAARDRGAKVGGYCWKEFLGAEYLSDTDKLFIKNNPENTYAKQDIKCTFCKADLCFTGDPSQHNPCVELADEYWDTHWVRCGEDTFLYYAINITSSKQIEERLIQSEERFKTLFDRAPIGYQSLDADGRFIDINQQWLAMLGYDHDEVIGKWFGDFLLPHYQDPFRKRFPLFKERGQIHSEFEMLHKSGQPLLIAFEGKIGYTDEGEFKQTHCVLEDITLQRQLERKLDDDRSLTKSIFDNTTDAIYVKDTSGKYLLFNKAAEEVVGKSAEEVLGKDDTALFSADEAKIVMAGDQKVLEAQEAMTYEETITDALGNVNLFLSTKGPVFNSDNELVGLFGIARNISERKTAEEALTYLSYHDHLTGLHNRRFYEEELSRLDTARNLPLTLVVCDLNGLKLINDSFGHLIGDELLKKAADVIKSCCRADDIIARHGGDEFVLLLPKTSSNEAESLTERIKEEIEKTKVGDISLSLGMGYETKTREEEDTQTIFKNAEDHLYRHKLYESGSARSKTIDLIISTLYEKNHREMRHSKRVSELSREIAAACKMSPDDLNQIRVAGLMHDIGKIGIDENILNKIGALTAGEWEEIKKHSEIGYRILSSVNEFSEISEFVLEHQEKWDGTGYPKGLKGTEISQEARIIAIADAYDAMTGTRTYRESLTNAQAVEEIKKHAGTQFDPEIVKICVQNVFGKAE